MYRLDATIVEVRMKCRNGSNIEFELGFIDKHGQHGQHGQHVGVGSGPPTSFILALQWSCRNARPNASVASKLHTIQ
jgi:hypothetical protein